MKLDTLAQFERPLGKIFRVCPALGKTRVQLAVALQFGQRIENVEAIVEPERRCILAWVKGWKISRQRDCNLVRSGLRECADEGEGHSKENRLRALRDRAEEFHASPRVRALRRRCTLRLERESGTPLCDKPDTAIDNCQQLSIFRAG